ncbi:hypothetical protein SEA_TOMAS_246 [Streptomyces phage Tomas]|uniref:Uncharacterized protein n=1 Tax=Streptomyces phage Tomas TaxID=2914443 RepID=A0AA49BV23_9CAUD|nr:hypothetical protein PP453_gp078 [Streptomyces phage Tomas]UMO76389.1 hypothetical protein SEA_TOMAS_246 [Streptomyces phage Tomas]
MEERLSITAKGAILNNDKEAIRNLTLAIGLLASIVHDNLGDEPDPFDLNALELIDQIQESVFMYLERHGAWTNSPEK